MMYLAIALLLTIVSSSSSDDDIIANMTVEEIQQVFHTDFVPKYEFVKVHLSERSHKRDLPVRSKMHIRAFGENISLWLHPGNSVLAGENTPIYYAKFAPDKPENVEFVQWHGLMRTLGHLYENPEWRASLIIGTGESGYAQVNGLIGSRRLTVRSLPTRVAAEYRRRRRAVGDSDDVDSPFHVVFQTTGNNEEELSGQSINSTALQQRMTQSWNGSIPDTLYSEVLVVVEYSIYRTYGRNIYDLLIYILAFMNGVDLKYRSVESPKIRLHISAIIVAEDPEATPYIFHNSYTANIFDPYRATSHAAKFFYAVKDTFPLESYDISLTITRQTFGFLIRGDILGITFPGAVCHKDDNSTITQSITLIKDNGAFSGVQTAAHEIGHLIGASHDEDITKDDCLYRNGYIMSSTRLHTKKSSDFSTCSIDEIYNTLQKNQLDCLFNPPPSAGKSFPELLPGAIKSLKEQCKSIHGKAPCRNPNGPTNICINIFCTTRDGRCLGTGSAAVDGTPCGDNKFCLHMECVSL